VPGAAPSRREPAAAAAAALPPLPKQPALAEADEGGCAPRCRPSARRVAPGDRVERRDVLLKLEAMKMQNEIRAPRAGTVDAVYVEVGRSVSNDQPLVSLKE
jgi:biotin carboxyl carrier protein